MIARTVSMESLRPLHPSERIEAYRHRLADALAAGRVDPAQIGFREVRGHALLDALTTYWRGKAS